MIGIKIGWIRESRLFVFLFLSLVIPFHSYLIVQEHIKSLANVERERENISLR